MAVPIPLTAYPINGSNLNWGTSPPYAVSGYSGTYYSHEVIISNNGTPFPNMLCTPTVTATDRTNGTYSGSYNSLVTNSSSVQLMATITNQNGLGGNLTISVQLVYSSADPE